jgi:hypothetical protein
MTFERRYTVSENSKEFFHTDQRLGELMEMMLGEDELQLGDEQTHEPFESGKWLVNNSWRRKVLSLGYENNTVVFVFEFKETEKQISFTNSHRESAKRGKGSEALKALELSFRYLANKKQKQVLVKFLTDGQEDTISWLEKFGYEQDERDINGIYGPESWSKTINPEIAPEDNEYK